MITVDLFDSNFLDAKSSVMGKTSQHIKYVVRQMEHDGIALFTDEHINAAHVEQVQCKYKIGWLHEPYCLHPQTYERALTNLHKFDAIMTYYQPFLDMDSKFVFCPYGGIWIPKDKWAYSTEKTKSVSMLVGGKMSAEGHIIRREVADLLRDNHVHVDFFGIYGESVDYSWQTKYKVLHDYRYTIVTETCREDNEFTEWLLDCFVMKTIPIFWGCPNVSDYFDERGVMSFETAAEAARTASYLALSNSHSVEQYAELYSSITGNFKLAQEYEITDDWFYENVFVERGYC